MNKPSNRADWLWTVTAVLFVLAPSLLYPLFTDSAVFSIVADAITKGHVPYRDVFELKPPGIHLAYAAIMWVTDRLGLSWPPALHGADIFFAAIAGLLIVRLAHRLGRPELGFPAATWYAALYFSTEYWGMAQAESWANVFLLTAILCCLRIADATDYQDAPTEALTEAPATEAASGVTASERYRWCALTGGLAGIVAVFKYPAVLPLLPFLWLALARARKEHGWRAAASTFGVVVGCAAIPLFLCYLWLRYQGAWNDYVDIQRGLVAPYAALNQVGERLPLSDPASYGQRLGDFLGYTAGWMAEVWFPVTLALSGTLVGRRWRFPTERLLLLTLGCGAVAVALQNKYFYYHWQPVLPILALLCCIGIAQPMRQTALPSSTISLVCALVAVLWSLTMQWANYRDAALYAAGHLSTEKWLDRFDVNGKFSAWDDTRVANYIRSQTRTDATIFIWGFQPTIYVLAERRAPTRFFFNQPVTAPFAPRRWRQELLRDLEQHPPALFLVAHNDATPWTNGLHTDSATQLRTWSALQQWLTRHYRRDTTIADFTIYRRASAVR